MSRDDIGKHQRIVRTDDLLESAVDGEVIALSIDKGMCYGFNGVGSRIWGLLEQETTVEAMCGILAEEFEVDRATCEHDVTRLVTELRSEGLIEVRR